MSLFEHIEKSDSDGNRDYRRAFTVANVRVRDRYLDFVKAADAQEFESRLAMVESDLKRTVEGACSENGAAFDEVYPSIRNALRVAAGHTAGCTHCNCNDCTGENCGCCETCNGKNCGEKQGSVTSAEACPNCKVSPLSGGTCEQCGYNSSEVSAASHDKDDFNDTPRGDKGVIPREEVTAATDRIALLRERQAAEPPTGDTYTQERIEMPSADLSGLSDEPSPKMDKSNAGDEWHTSQDPPVYDSVRNERTQQDVEDQPTYNAPLDQGGVVKTVDADTPIQPEFNVAPNTDVFPNRSQAQPVTSSSKWRVL